MRVRRVRRDNWDCLKGAVRMPDRHLAHLLTLSRFLASILICALAGCCGKDLSSNGALSPDGRRSSSLRGAGSDSGPFNHPVNRQANAPLVALPSGDERLIYGLYRERGAASARNIVPDFSRAGYRGGGVGLPARASVPVHQTLVPNAEGDDYRRIQAAIDAVGALRVDDRGLRGAVLLRRGQYRLSRTLVIR